MQDRPYKDIGDRLADARKRKGFSTALEAAAAYGWPKSTYAAHEYGARKPKPETMKNYARRFGVGRFWLEFGKDETPAAHAVRMAGIIGAGQEVWPFDDLNETVESALDGEVAEAFRVKGDSMQPVAREGDILFFGRTRSPRNLIGRECIVELEDGRRFFKILRYGPKPGLYNLDSYNAPGIEGVGVVKAGELLAIRRA